MYIRQNCIVAISLIVIVLTPIQAISEQFIQWKLPEGAKARLGKGRINDITCSSDGRCLLLRVRSVYGFMIYRHAKHCTCSPSIPGGRSYRV